MVSMPSSMSGDLKRVDVLRQLYQHERALSCLDELHRAGVMAVDTTTGLALRIRILRALRRFDEADRLLSDRPADEDDAVLRENRIAVRHRCGHPEEAWGLSSMPVVGGTGDRVAVALARVRASSGDVRYARQLLQDRCLGPLRAIAVDASAPLPDAVAYAWWLHFMLRLGEVEPAREHALLLASAVGWRHQATAASVLGRLDMPDRARALLADLLEKHRGHPPTWRRTISTLRGVGHLQAAWSIVHQADACLIDVPPTSLGEPPEAVAMRDVAPLLVERALLELAAWDGSDRSRLRRAAAAAADAVSRAPYLAGAVWVKARVLRAAGDEAAQAELRAMVAAEVGTADRNVAVEYGHSHADAGRWDRAVDVYRSVLADRLQDREAHLGLINVLARRTPPASPPAASLTEAVSKLCDLLPEDTVMLSLAGERLAQNGHYALAETVFQAALAANPEHDLSRTGLIRACGWSRNFAGAEGLPTSSAPIVRLAGAMLDADRGRVLSAHGKLQQLYASVAGPEDRDRRAHVALWLSTSLRWMFRHDEARELIERELTAPPDADEFCLRAADLHDELGWIWFDQHRHGKAQAAFRAALAVEPRHVGALRGMIQTCRALGDVSGALSWAERGFVLYPQDASLRCETAWLYGHQHRHDDALRLIDEALEREVANQTALEWRVVYLERAGRRSDAIAAARVAMRYRPESASIVETACGLWLRAGDGATAMRLSATAADVHPDDPKFAVMAASVQDQVTASAEALARFGVEHDRLGDLARFPAVPDAVAMRARMLRRRRQGADALAVLRADDDLAALPEIRAELIEADIVAADPDPALSALAELHQSVPWSHRVTRQYAVSLAMYGRLGSALAVAANAVDRARRLGDPRPVEMLVLYGDMLVRANRHDEALAVAAEAVAHPARGLLEARVLQIEAHGAVGHLEQAHRLAIDLRRARPASRRTELTLGRTLEFVGRTSEAADLLRPLSHVLAHDRRAAAAASWMYRAIGAPDVARRIMEGALQVLPRVAGLNAEYAWTLVDLGGIVGAEARFGQLAQATRSPQDQALGLAGLVWCAIHRPLRTGDDLVPDRLKRLERHIKSTDQPIAEAYFAASVGRRLLAYQTKEPAERRRHLLAALRHANHAVAIDDVSGTRRLLGRVLYELGPAASARDHFERSIALHPFQGDYAGLGLLLLSQGEHDEALRFLNEGLDRFSASHGDLTEPTSRADLLAAIGATLLDRDLRTGTVTEHARVAERHLLTALEIEPRHLFAVHNYATVLALLGRPAEGVRLIDNVLAEVDRERSRWTDPKDVEALKRRLLEITAAMGQSRWRRRRLRRGLRLRPGDAVLPRRGVTPGRRRERRLRTAGRILALMAAAVIGLVTVDGVVGGFKPGPVTASLILSAVTLAVGMYVGGKLLPLTDRIKVSSIEISYPVPLTSAAGDIDLPHRVPAHGFGRLDAARTQWITLWSSETRLPRLGPTVAPMINGYYSHRDQVLPWRRR